MEDSKVFDVSLELPDGYQVQLMVLQDFPGGRRRRGARMNIFRSRVWIGHESESDPLVHCSQEHADRAMAIDACYSMLLAASERAIRSLLALQALRESAHHHFSGVASVG